MSMINMPTIIPIRNNIISNNIVYNSQWIVLLSLARNSAMVYELCPTGTAQPAKRKGEETIYFTLSIPVRQSEINCLTLFYSLFNWFIHCSFIVHSLFIHCSFIVHSLFIHCSFIVHSLFIHCSFVVNSRFTPLLNFARTFYFLIIARDAICRTLVA